MGYRGFARNGAICFEQKPIQHNSAPNGRGKAVTKSTGEENKKCLIITKTVHLPALVIYFTNLLRYVRAKCYNHPPCKLSPNNGLALARWCVRAVPKLREREVPGDEIMHGEPS